MTTGAPALAAAPDLARLARLFHALSDETRLAIVHRLRAGERCVCELTDLLDAAQSRLSFHLKVLREVGLVHDRRDGRWVYYSLCPEAFALVESALGLLEPTEETTARAVGAAGCCR